MPIDPSLITDTLSRWQTPQFAMPDPLAQFAKIQALKNGITQQQIDQQQLQSGALDLQTKKDNIAGTQALRTAIQQSIKPGQNGAPPQVDHNAVIQSLGQGGHGDLIDSYMQGVATRAKSQADLAKVENENQQSTVDMATRIFSKATDQATWDQGIAYLHGHGGDPQQLGIPPVYTPDAQAKVVQLGMSLKDQLAQKAAAQTSQSKADTVDLSRDRLSDERIERALNAVAGATNQDELNALRSQAIKTGASPAQVNAIPMRFSPDAMTTYSRSRLNPDQRVTTDQAAAKETAEEADRKVTQGQRAQDIAIARGRLGVEQQRLKAETAVAGPFVGLPPQERAKAENAYDKDTKDYTDKISSARGLQDMIAQAQGGNKAAPALIPIAELRQFVNRVNSAELQSVGVNAGSVVDKIQGYIDGKTAGQPIPPALLTDMLAVSKGQEKAANRGYLGRLAANKAAFGASPPPIDIESVYNGGTAPAAPGLKVGDPVTLKGKPATVTAVHPDGSFDADFKK